MPEHDEPPAQTDEATAKKVTEEGAKETAATKEEKPISVELDDFGLPIRKPRKTIVVDSDSDEPNDKKEKDENPTELPIKHSPVEPQPEKDDSDQPKQTPVALPPVTESSTAAEAAGSTVAASSSKEEAPAASKHAHSASVASRHSALGEGNTAPQVSEWSHQHLAPRPKKEEVEVEDEWQEMPSYAPYDIYNDDGKLIAREAGESDDEVMQYGTLGGAGKGYTRVQIDEDARSATSMDDNTAYLFKERSTDLQDDEDARDPLAQMQATKNLLTEGQRVAYVGLVKMAMVEMIKDLDKLEKTKAVKKQLDLAVEAMQMWSQKMMVRLYGHMDIESREQIMIEQLAEHGLEARDLTPQLMQNARVKNPVADDAASDQVSISSPRPESFRDFETFSPISPQIPHSGNGSPPPPPYQNHEGEDLPEVRTPSQLPNTASIDIDLRWTVLCDLFLVLIADSVYDSRSRQLLEKVGELLEVPWLEICRFEKRVIDALEMQEAANKENWNEDEHMATRKKMARNRRLVMMGLATVGGGLVIGLSAGLLAPVIGAGLAAGFTTIGVAGTGSFLGGTAAAALITTGAAAAGGTIGVRAANRRTGAVKTFEYRPLHNNKRVNLIVTVAGWMNGKIDDVRLPYSTVDPIMGDMYSVFWEPEMLQSMGDTINILATEALTQGLQQVLGSTILIALMASLQAPVLLTKLSYLIDNPWSVSLARADAAGLILADSLIDRNLGVRPITLVGFSLGSRVIFSCLKELAKKGAFGLIQNAYLFGSPNVAKNDEYLRAKSVVSGRFVNGYATNDWILGYLFRATSGGIMRVAGLAPVEVAGIENKDVTALVPGHMAYRSSMPKLLRECGWIVESDEFTEIEDPDPDNHEKRQRELINEIEEARKELEKKPKKNRFSLFRKKGEKKEWETYDESFKNPDAASDVPGEGVNPNGNVMFDIEAIQREVAQLAASGIEVKQLESTLPPLRLDLSNQPTDSQSALKKTKSYNDSIGTNSAALKPESTDTTSKKLTDNHSYDEYDEFGHNGNGEITMSFDTPPTYKATKDAELPETQHSNYVYREPERSWTPPKQERPPLTSSYTAPAPINMAPDHNAWADEFDDDFGKEKEIELSFA